MAARTVLKELTIIALVVCALMLFTIAQAYPAQAAPAISLAISSNVTVNSNYPVQIILTDSGSVSGKTITLSTVIPGSTITPLTVVTDATGHASATFHTSTQAGYNNISATYSSTPFILPVLVSPGPPSSLALTAAPALRLANGISKAMANATVTDQYGNPIGNAAIHFTKDGADAGSIVTGPDGNASMVIGPYGSSHTANITADIAGLNRAASVRFLDRNNLFLLRLPAASMPINSNVEVDAVFYDDLGNNTKAAGVPLDFIAYAPDFSILGTYHGVTDANGIVKFYFTMSPNVGNNTIVVSNSDLDGNIKATIISGEGGDVSNIILISDPASPVLADGHSKYTLSIQAVDSGGNPVINKPLKIIKNQDSSYTIDVTTNTNGYALINIPASMFVSNDEYLVSAENQDHANNTTVFVNRSITLGYKAGPATTIKVRANPNAVANANVTTPNGAYDVHETDIITTITDVWGHPLGGQAVNVASLNTTLGSISGPASGVTSDSGEFTTQYTLNSSNKGVDTTVGAPVRAVSGSLTGYCNVLYTDNSFLSIKSNITPKNNVSVNDTINVNITVRGIGWKIRGVGYDIALVFDSSGSMDWLSTTIFPDNGTAQNGTIPAIKTSPSSYADDTSRPATGSGSSKRYYWDLDTRNWHLLNSYTYTGNGSQAIQIMVSSSYYNYSSSGSYYYLKVTGPGNKNYSTYEYTTTDSAGYNNKQTVGGSGYELAGADYARSSNENYVIISNPTPGYTYKIYGAYDYYSSKGNAEYNMMVLTTPKRLGLKNSATNDSDSAAKVAARMFVDTMTDNQISVIYFNTSSGVQTHLKTVNSINKSIINNGINSLNANGGTQISLGIARAITELTGPYSNSSNKKVVILLSDGYSQTPSNDLTEADNAKDKNITIFTIGMGMPDEYNLRSIAEKTGGTYNLTTSAVDLQHVYGDIAGELNKVVANKTDMHIITNCTMINGTLYPDAVYVPGSAYVHYPNGTVIQQEPTINTNGTYDLRWNPGVIKLNDTWSVNYQLKVMMPGQIQPITNESYINFSREDGSNDTASFLTESMFVNGTGAGNMSGSLLPKPVVTILSPLPTSGFNTTPPTQTVVWSVNYTGNYTYYETIIQVDSNGNPTTLYPSAKYPAGTFDGNSSSSFHGTYNGNNSSTYHFDWDSKQNADDYTITIIADDHHGDPGSGTIVLRIRYANGQITLE